MTAIEGPQAWRSATPPAQYAAGFGLLASSSFAALLIGGLPAFAACPPGTQVTAGGYVNSGSVPGLCVTTSINGYIANNGTVDPSGIKFTGGTLSGELQIRGTIHGGIFLDSASTITDSINTAIQIQGAAFTGGISNAGVISPPGMGISVGALGLFSGGISNSGTIAAASSGIDLNNIGTFSGGISNSGTISFGIGYAISVAYVGTFTGGITNSGTILGASGAADYFYGSGAFQGGISNSGTISMTGGGGIGVWVAQYGRIEGGISNSGTISVGGLGIGLGYDVSVGCCHVGNFSNGNIFNSGTISAHTGIHLVNVDTFAGNISNAGTISGVNGIVIAHSVSFTPGSAIINSGTIIGTTAAIDASGATSPVTIDQTGGLISGAINLSSYADVLNISGGTIAGDIVGHGASNTLNFNLGSGTFIYDAAYGFSGIHQVNVNSGLAILDGTNSATNVTVNGGTLEVGDAAHTAAQLTSTNGVDVTGGALAGHGTVFGNVNVASGGTLSPGGSIGTLTINGNLVLGPGSFYAVEVGQTQSSMTQVNGSVTVNGAKILLNPQLGVHNVTNLQILSWTGSFTGAFNPTISFGGSTILFDPSITFGPNGIFVSALGTQLVLPANAPLNAQNVGGAINNFIVAGGNLPAGFRSLGDLTGDALNTAANQLAGQGQGAFAPLGFEAGNQFLGLMLNPYVEGRGAGFGPAGAAPLAYASEPASAPAARAFNALALDGSTSGRGTIFAPRLSIWSSAYGGSGSITGNAFTGAAGTDSQIYGVATGLDYLVAPNTVVGLALGGGGAAWQSGQGLGSGHSSMFQGGLYGTSRLGPAYVSGAFAYSQQDVTTDRVATLAGYDVLQGNFAANVVSARLESGYRLPYGFVAVTPYGAVQTQAMFLPAYSEYATVGASQFALSYTSRTFAATRTEAGAWFDSDYFMSRGVKLYGRLAWAHDFDNEGTTTALFQSLPGQAFVINSAKPAHDGALVTAGFEYRLIDGWSVLGKFDGEYSATTAIFAGTGTLRKVW